MDTHITHHHFHYRLLGSRESADLVASRLDRLVRDRVVSALSEALDQALADDPAVYIIQQVRSGLVLNLADVTTDSRLAQRWGMQMARDIMRAIAVSAKDGTTFVRFRDQADYITHFIIDLLDERAWHRWFYGPFAYLKTQPKADAIQTVLLENRQHLPEILSNLHQLRMLEKLLVILDRPTVQLLWTQGLGGASQATPEMMRPLFARALELIDRLALWSDPGPDREALFLAYLSAGPAPADWRDRRGLALALLEILQFLLRRNALRRPQQTQSFQEQLDEVLHDFDWLDTAYLKEAVLIITAEVTDRIEPIFRRVVQLVDELGEWAAQPRPATRYLRSRYRPGISSPLVGDEVDIALDIVRFLLRQGFMRRQARQQLGFQARLHRALAHFDPTLREKLGAGITDLLSQPAADQPDLPTRLPQHRLTPRQKALLANLLTVLDEEEFSLDQARRASPDNALRWYAALIARFPDWANDSLVMTTIRMLLAAWDALTPSQSPLKTLQALQRGQLETGLGDLPKARRQQAARVLKPLVDLGDPGIQLVAHLQRGQAGPELAELLPEAGIETQCAGLFLLLRAVLDSRLPALVQETMYPPGGEPTHLAPFLLALGLRWGGETSLRPSSHGDPIVDPGLGPLSGLSRPPFFNDLSKIWAATTTADHRRFQTVLLRTLAGQRLMRGAELHLYRLPWAMNRTALIAGDESGTVWPLGQVLDADPDLSEVLASWHETWTRMTGYQPIIISADEPVLASLRAAAWPDIQAIAEADTELVQRHIAGQEALSASLRALESGQLDLAEVDLTISLTAIALLRIWARWLRQFATSSVPYLLTNFIRRPGYVVVKDNHIFVRLENRPLDVVLELAGYLAALEQLDWLGGKTVHFALAGI